METVEFAWCPVCGCRFDASMAGKACLREEDDGWYCTGLLVLQETEVEFGERKGGNCRGGLGAVANGPQGGLSFEGVWGWFAFPKEKHPQERGGSLLEDLACACEGL
jgi:hypothetical protein